MSSRNWKVALNEVKKLKEQGIGLLYDRVGKLVEVYNSPGFREWCDENSRDVFTELDSYLSDVGWSYQDMEALYQHYPSADQWQGKSITDMVAEYWAANKKKREPGERFSYKAECERLKKQLERADTKISRLESENASLQARVSDLERIIRLLETKAA